MDDQNLFKRMASQGNVLKSRFDFNSLEAQPPNKGFSSLKDKVEQLEEYDEGDKSKSIVETLKINTNYFLSNTLMGRLWTQTLMLLSVLSLIQYIYLTYLTRDTTQGTDFYKFFFFLELSVAIAFVLDWTLNFLASEHKLKFVVSFESLVDMTTVIPVFATYDVQCPTFEGINSVKVGIYYVLCGLTTTRILRSLRFRKSFYNIEDEVKRTLADMSIKIVVMLLFNSAVMQYFEPNQGLDFHSWNYFMLVTITTVGYGDIAPETILGRFFSMGMIIVAIIIVPQMTNELMEKINKQSYYARLSYEPKTSSSSHVLVCGDLRSSSLDEFFHELFHEDHEAGNLCAVVLQPEAPSYEMLQILEDPTFSNCVSYLEGNALNDKDLKRAKAGQATAIFIMTNKFSSNPDEEDAKTILQQFSIQRFLRQHSSEKESLFCLQLIRPENKRHLVTSAGESSTDLVICLNEIKMGVIAKAVIFPGANTLIMNLLTSFADEKEYVQAKTMDGIETLDDDEDSDWLGEYQRGCDWEIYTTELSSSFEGTTFCFLSEILYQKLGIVLFALEVEDVKKDTRRMLINPADYIIPAKGGDFVVEAFVLAKNKAQSDLTFSKNNSDSIIGNGINFSHLSSLANWPSIMSKTQNTKVHATPEVWSSGSKADEREKQAWQVLLHRREMEKTSESLQEEQQKLEDRLLRENYFIRDAQMDLGDAIIRSSVSEEMPFVDSHIIIIGKALSNLYDLIRPLRAKQLGDLKHIIIIYPQEFPPAVWQRISIFESIWIIRGSALEEADIRRAGIFKAKQVVVLADSSSDLRTVTTGSAAGLDALVDTDAIFCYQCVRRMNEMAHVVVEIVRHTNVGYLDPESVLNSSDVDYKFTPQFAAGALFATSLLDTLVCQAFYNTKIIEVIGRLIGSGESLKDDAVGKGRASPGKNGSAKAPTGPPSFLTMPSSSIYQIPIPDGLESRTYGALYRLLSRRKQIPLGILRGVFSHTKSGPKSNKMPYVFTNPPKDTELFTCDKVFILSQTPVGINRVMKDETKEMQMYSNLRSRKKTAEDIMGVVGDLREEVRRSEDRVQAQYDDMHSKFDAIMHALGASHPNANSHGYSQGGSSSSSRPISASAKLTGSPSVARKSFNKGSTGRDIRGLSVDGKDGGIRDRVLSYDIHPGRIGPLRGRLNSQESNRGRLNSQESSSSRGRLNSGGDSPNNVNRARLSSGEGSGKHNNVSRVRLNSGDGREGRDGSDSRRTSKNTGSV